MKYLNQAIENELSNQGVVLIRFVDISKLPTVQNRQFPHAIVFTLPLTAKYVKEVFDTPDYVKSRVENNFNFDDDEYLLTEHKIDYLADHIAEFITNEGYKAFSQSDKSLIKEGAFDGMNMKTLLPNKTIALLGGLGWIGKNNLLITSEYGAAQCVGTILTDAPLVTILCEPLLPKCGNCNICVAICEKEVLSGRIWNTSVSRDEIVDVYGCSTCMKCLVHCPWTRAYINSDLKLNTP